MTNFDFEDLKELKNSIKQIDDLLNQYGSQLDKFAFEIIKEELNGRKNNS